MITMLGSPRRSCDGITRRETLAAGALTLLGGDFTLPKLLAAEARKSATARLGKAKNVILLYLLGGAPTQDMWDLKPDARGRGSRRVQADRTRPRGVRSANTCREPQVDAQGRDRALGEPQGRVPQLPAELHRLSNNSMPDQHPRDTDPPSMGCVCEYLRGGRGDLPDYVYMPCWLGWGQAFRRAGPYAGFLGQRYDALTTECKPVRGQGREPGRGQAGYRARHAAAAEHRVRADLTIDRLNTRRTLLQQIDDRAQANWKPTALSAATTARSSGRSAC